CPISFNVSSSTAVNGSIHFFGILAYATCDGLFTIHSLIKLVVLDYLEYRISRLIDPHFSR
ncbi:MAG: hypothetical protein Q8Q81_19875, partial [Oxalobacteraceae bacterium]|nr:hypothetical protein [Oxalobacteraceae bacterium]